MAFFTLERVRRWMVSGFWLALFNLVGVAFPLVMSMILTRVLTKDEYGHYAYIIVFVLFLDFTSLPGLATAVIQAVARGQEKTLVVATNARRRWSIIGTVILVGLGCYWGWQGDNERFLIFGCAAVVFPFYHSYSNFLYYLVGRQDYRRLALAQTWHLTATQIPIIAVTLWTRDYRAALVTHFIVTPLVRFLMYRRTCSEVPENSEVDPDYFRFGGKMTLVSMVGSLETYLDRILVGTFLGTADLATFHIGKTIGTQNRTIWNIAAHYVVPSLSKRQDMKRFPKELFAVLAIYIAAVAFLFLVIPWAIVLLYPEGYGESTVAARWFLVAAMLAGPAGLFQTYLQVTGRVWSMWMIHVIKVAVYLSSLVWLMGRFGVEGIYFAAIVAAIVQSLMGGTYLLFTDRGMPPRAQP